MEIHMRTPTHMEIHMEMHTLMPTHTHTHTLTLTPMRHTPTRQTRKHKRPRPAA